MSESVLNQPPGAKSDGASPKERTLTALAGSLLAILGLREGGPIGVALAAGGGYLLYRGASGQTPLAETLGIRTEQGDIAVHVAMTINRPAADLYTYWRNFENLPMIMRYLQSVTVDGDRSHWVAAAPAGTSVEWDAEITDDQSNERIAWRSLEGAQVPNSGEVTFHEQPHNRGTVVQVKLGYQPPAGTVGALVAKLFGKEPTQEITADLRRFKSIMEAGEFPTTRGQSSGRTDEVASERAERQDDQAPPAWSGVAANQNAETGEGDHA